MRGSNVTDLRCGVTERRSKLSGQTKLKRTRYWTVGVCGADRRVEFTRHILIQKGLAGRGYSGKLRL